MADNRKWIFYDSTSKAQSNPVSTEDAQMAIFKLKPKDWARLYIWTSGWDSWQPLELFLKSDQSYFIGKFKGNEPEEQTVTTTQLSEVFEMSAVTDTQHREITKAFSNVVLTEETFESYVVDMYRQFDGDEMTWSDTKKPTVDFRHIGGLRRYGSRDVRHDLKIQVLLNLPNGQIFKTFSQNISLSGSLLEDNLPIEAMHSSFDIVIVNRKAKDQSHARVYLKAKTVGEGITQRITFVNMDKTKRGALEKLLLDYIQNKDVSLKRKKAG